MFNRNTHLLLSQTAIKGFITITKNTRFCHTDTASSAVKLICPVTHTKSAERTSEINKHKQMLTEVADMHNNLQCSELVKKKKTTNQPILIRCF